MCFRVEGSKSGGSVWIQMARWRSVRAMIRMSSFATAVMSNAKVCASWLRWRSFEGL